MSDLTSQNPLLSENIAHVGSFMHSVFVFVFEWAVGVTSQRAFQPVYINIGFLSLIGKEAFSIDGSPYE